MAAPENTFKTRLLAGQTLWGCWAGFADSYATEVLSTAEFDWLVLDGEHAPNDLRSLMGQLQVLQGKHSHGVVRLPVGNEWLIKQMLDAGAQTLLIPMVETPEQAAELVRAMRYPPEGIRGSGAALARASMFSLHGDYIQTATRRFVCWCRSKPVRASKILMRLLPQTAWTGCLSALLIWPQIWGIRATRMRRQCRPPFARPWGGLLLRAKLRAFWQRKMPPLRAIVNGARDLSPSGLMW